MPVCLNCGTKNSDDKSFCDFCGAPIEKSEKPSGSIQTGTPLSANLSEAFSHSSTNAKIAMIVGLLSLVMCGFLLGITAIIVGTMESKKIESGLSPAAGRRLIQIGIIAGVIGIILQIFWIILGFGGRWINW
jgi:hypothetical protein